MLVVFSQKYICHFYKKNFLLDSKLSVSQIAESTGNFASFRQREIEREIALFIPPISFQM